MASALEPSHRGNRSVATSIAVPVVLVAVAALVGWLLVAVPAGLIAVSRIGDRLGALRERRRAERAVRS